MASSMYHAQILGPIQASSSTLCSHNFDYLRLICEIVVFFLRDSVKNADSHRAIGESNLLTTTTLWSLRTCIRILVLSLSSILRNESNAWTGWQVPLHLESSHYSSSVSGPGLQIRQPVCVSDFIRARSFRVVPGRNYSRWTLLRAI